MNPPNPDGNKAIEESSERSLEELKIQVAQVTRDFARFVEAESRKNPWKLAGVAALVAVVIGFLLGRRTKQ